MTLTRPDVDLTDGDFYAGDSRSIYKWMRENEPVFRDRNGLAAAATYAAVIEAERNPELFSNAGGIRPDQPGVEMMIEMDDPQHLLRRKLVNSGFTRKRVKDLEGSIISLCDTLIDAVCERGECDFVWDIAAPLPMAVIGDMLGVRPEEREMFLQWSDDLVGALSSTADPEKIQVTMDAFAAYSEYMIGMIAERKARADRRSRQRPRARRGRGREARGPPDRHRGAAAADRRRRDHPAHAVGWHQAAAAPPRSAPAADQRPGPAAQRDRRDAALDRPGEEHGPHHHRRHRVPRHAAQARARR